MSVHGGIRHREMAKYRITPRSRGDYKFYAIVRKGSSSLYGTQGSLNDDLSLS
jgi:hypothetical protein